jgi:protein-disulfide isomerase
MSARILATFLALFGGLAGAQPLAQVKALQIKVDSLSNELRTLEKILALRGVDIERDRITVAKQDSTFQIPVEAASVLGDPKAPVTLVLFTDLQCPYCARMAPILQSLHEQHPKSLRISFRHFPLVSIHDKSLNGHLALWAAQKQGRLWDYYFKLAPSFRALSDSVLVVSAREIGLDMDRFETDRHSSAAQDGVSADMKLGEQVGVQGTPSLYLDGKSTNNPDEIGKVCAKYEGPSLPRK